MNLAPYVQIARVDHWFKNVFVLPGVVFAIYDSPAIVGWELAIRVVLALLAIGLVASSNYVINEILDAPNDALHPVKKNRPVPSGLIDKRLGYVEWLGLAVLGFAISASLGGRFVAVAAVLWIMGFLYNVPPIRLKDKPYLDVLSESANNPLRLLVGWYAAGMTQIPPASLVAAYWMIGAFFMSVKRFAEFRRIGDVKVAAQYRASFAHYTEERLWISAIYYAVAFGLFFGIFIMRYRLELLLSIPFIAGVIGYYIHLGFLTDSPAQYPEHLYKQKGFVLFMTLCVIVMLVLLFLDVPVLLEIFVPTIRVQ
ncbi:MAG: UbiA prenyltransferase family protein [Gammaproteobacteria bacterium]|nr:UbiA prenyltransferase family protein [Gammaproteobacteria bacterium]